MIIGLMVEKHINLRCSDQSFYECVGSKISKGTQIKANKIETPANVSATG